MDTWIAFISTIKWHEISVHSAEEKALAHAERLADEQSLGVEGVDFWVNIEVLKMDSGVGVTL